ncbi:MAG: hypothetical protein JW818_05215 [Pirellulales bacterium]|nr:hypothetical protein [Pirellulales bacterium]
MASVQDLTPKQAREFLLKKKRGAIRVGGLIDLRGAKIDQLSASISCHGLDATGSELMYLPDDIQIESRLILDNCAKLETLPEGLVCGSISLRNCGYLIGLPEGLNTWFLDLSECGQFSTWPTKGTIHRGILRLRNCVQVQTLPDWLGMLGQLDLSGCATLAEVPDGIRVSGWIDVGGTSITELPASLSDAPLRWRGVPVDERIAFHPELLSAREILAERNAEIRRVMIERMGYLRFAEEAGAKVLDKDEDAGGPRRLLRIELDDDEPLIGLACSCPSTSRQYFLRVPPTTKKCHQAAAWIAGFDDPKRYRPVLET